MIGRVIGTYEAVALALRSVGLDMTDARCTKAVYNEGYYELLVFTSFQKYDFYVDVYSGDVLGINIEPVHIILRDDEGAAYEITNTMVG